MHASSLENMQKCYERFVIPSGFASRSGVSVLDLGGADLNGSYRAVFPSPPFEYRTADLTAGPGVDLVLEDPYRIPVPDASVDIVLSGQMLEHCELFWLTFQEMIRVLKPDGLLILIAPSSGPIHRFPVDCYRFYPDAYRALAKYAGCQLYAVWMDDRGPWRDLVGVFGKRIEIPIADPLLPSAVLPPPAPGAPEEELTAGAEDYLGVLVRIHETLSPRRYLEIGVRHGKSLVLAACPAIGVDPASDVSVQLPETTRLIQCTSDWFFERPPHGAVDVPPDLVLIDGMHLFEYALRDFMHVERIAHPSTLVVIDDIYPSHPRQAQRDRETRVWTGDVWKLYQCLADVRPDLLLIPLDTRPTGLLLVAGLQPESRLLWDRYNPLVRRYRDELVSEPPQQILDREGVWQPDVDLLPELLGLMRRLQDEGADTAAVACALAPLRKRLGRQAA